ncbi:MAG: aminotransferase class I/II-fold pyridoxal phosphate-dependent enzyme [Candidatus Falkowbacteria bacterium]
MKRLDYFRRVVQILKAGNLYPDINTISGSSSSPELIINGKKYLTFCSNNYLGIADNEEIKKEVINGIKKYGVGSGSTRLLSGTLDVQVEFEKQLAEFYGYVDSITFSSGYMANIGTVRMLVDSFPYFKVPFLDKKGVIFSDELNHASLIDAIRLSKAEREIYKHNDLKDLEKLLNKHKKKNKLIITDGIFSMDGDFADLVGLSKMAKEYDALIFVDDSHGAGVIGPKGEGTAHHLGVEKDIDVVMGSFTKAWGSIGGFITTKTKDMSEYLRVTARSYIFSDPILPSVVLGLIKAKEIIENGKDLREKTINNALYLRGELKRMGYEVTGEDFMPIIPPILHSEKNAIKFSKELSDSGILAPAIRKPAVENGRERLRLTTMSTHTRKQIDYLLENMSSIGKKLKVI